jgi:hypothetical protein
MRTVLRIGCLFFAGRGLPTTISEAGQDVQVIEVFARKDEYIPAPRSETAQGWVPFVPTLPSNSSVQDAHPGILREVDYRGETADTVRNVMPPCEANVRSPRGSIRAACAMKRDTCHGPSGSKQYF